MGLIDCRSCSRALEAFFFFLKPMGVLARDIQNYSTKKPSDVSCDPSWISPLRKRPLYKQNSSFLGLFYDSRRRLKWRYYMTDIHLWTWSILKPFNYGECDRRTIKLRTNRCYHIAHVVGIQKTSTSGFLGHRTLGNSDSLDLPTVWHAVTAEQAAELSCGANLAEREMLEE